MLQRQTQIEKVKSANGVVKVFIVKTKVFCDDVICGLPLFEILAREMQGYEILFLQEDDSLFEQIKRGSAFCEKAAVLFSNSPCIERKDIEDAFNTIKTAISFGKSFVASGEFIKNARSLNDLIEFEVFLKEEYLVVKDEHGLARAKDILQERIANKLSGEGVEVQDCTIDFDAEIESGARLASSQILGSSNIGAAIILSSVVENCIVASGVTAQNCVLKNCVVTKDVNGKKIDGGMI